jgi:DNA-binding TFAR19-related protein (PDSD5 family)
MSQIFERKVKGTCSMPTPEERMTTLEYNLDQFKAEATTYYQEMAMQVTMSKGLTEDAVKRLMQLRVQVDKRFNSTDQQLAEVKQEVAGVKQELAGVQTTLIQILARLPEKP